ncbi:MAG TPA: diguanylate cyclase [Geobacterales bacterium]|nr:diguanylate cyclase [Geobacterales bacterium]
MPNTKIARILYMEDDPGLARLLQKQLQRKGYEVDIAENGEVGLGQLAEHSYDLLLVDYHMPVLGGIEVIGKLAEHGCDIPTIMVTGNGNEKVAVEALKLGATDYIVKDVDMGYLELLPMVIEQVMSKQQMVRERQQMLRDLRENEERYRGLVELSPDGIAIHVQGRFVFVNEAGAKLLGCRAPEELLGKQVSDVVHPDYHQIVDERLRLMESNARAVPWLEERLIRLDGSGIHVELAGVPFVYQGQKALQVIIRDITERKLAEERLEYLAHYDTLTGLPNRMLFFDRFTQATAQARRYGHMMALLFLDLDRFKIINDTLGHDAGDEVLIEVANRLKHCLRKSDSVARMGGDEFTLILSKISTVEDTTVVANKIITSLSAPFILAGEEHTIGASIGGSIFPNDGDDSESLLKKADIAMYRAKEEGRNTFRLYCRHSGDATDPAQG